MNRFKLKFIVALMIPFLASCFDTHPYDVEVTGERGINSTNISKIEQITKDKDTIRFVCMSDSHQWYTDTDDAVADINRRKDSIDFVIHCGDITDTGTRKEFEWADDVLSGLQLPYVVLIGNHDFLGTGEEYYYTKYGPGNFSMIAGRIKFIFINTNATEYDYVASVPDLNYLRAQSVADSSEFDRTVVCMHARPYSDQFNNNIAEPFQYYVQNFLHPIFCLNGHDHNIQTDDLFHDGLMYYGMPSMEKRTYFIFTITPSVYYYEIVKY